MTPERMLDCRIAREVMGLTTEHLEAYTGEGPGDHIPHYTTSGADALSAFKTLMFKEAGKKIVGCNLEVEFVGNADGPIWRCRFNGPTGTDDSSWDSAVFDSDGQEVVECHTLPLAICRAIENFLDSKKESANAPQK